MTTHLKLLSAFLVLLVPNLGFNEDKSDSFRVTIRELEFDPNGEFVRITQKRILKDLNKGRSQLIHRNLWPVDEWLSPKSPKVSPDSKQSARLPMPIYNRIWSQIERGLEETGEGKVASQQLELSRHEKGVVTFGDDTWNIFVGNAVTEYTYNIKVRGPKRYSVYGLNSEGVFEGEIWDGFTVKMVSEDSESSMRLVYVSFQWLGSPYPQELEFNATSE